VSDSVIVPGSGAAAEDPRSRSVVTQTANLLTASRFMFAGIWLAAFLAGAGPETMGTIAFAGAASDFLDGRVARWTHSVSGVGRWLDSVADLVFVLTALGCESRAGTIPLYIPVLIAASFAQYAIDSVLIRGSSVPIRSRLGHWGGILNYVLVILLAWIPPPLWPRVLLRDLSPVIATFYVAAILERMLSYRPGWRGAAGIA
jgi:phosphatidylglycerophosphate synthase